MELYREEQNVCLRDSARPWLKYKYAEGNLVDLWDTWWAQNNYFAKIDTLIDQISGEIIQGQKSGNS